MKGMGKARQRAVRVVWRPVCFRWGVAQTTSSMRDLSSQMADMRRQLEGDEQLRTLMAGLRGANIDDSDYAAEGVTMSLVEVCLLWCCGHTMRVVAIVG